MIGDAYVRKARLAPVVLAAAPLLFLALAVGVSPAAVAGITLAPVAAIYVVGVGIARDRGRRIQPELWRAWGGEPTVQLMRWRGGNPSEVSVKHAGVRLMSAQKLPDARAEEEDPEQADQIYREALASARVQVREAEGHRILSDANAEYGFRRNCLGLKTIGIAMSVLSGMAAILLWALSVGDHPDVYIFPIVAGILWLIMWKVIVSDHWVKTAADRYAEHFFETVRKIEIESNSVPSTPASS